MIRPPWRIQVDPLGVWRVEAPEGDRYEVLVEVGGVQKDLGSFTSLEAARQAIERVHHSARARLRRQR